MIWTGEPPLATEVEESMEAYFNTLQGFLLLSHGSTVRAGPTLSSCIHVSVKKVVDSSFQLLKESVSSFGNLSLSLSGIHDAHRNAHDYDIAIQSKVFPMHICGHSVAFPAIITFLLPIVAGHFCI